MVRFGFASAEFAFATYILGKLLLTKECCVGDFSTFNVLI